MEEGGGEEDMSREKDIPIGESLKNVTIGKHRKYMRKESNRGTSKRIVERLITEL